MSDINNQEGKKNIVDKIYDIPLDEYLDYVHQIPDVTDQEVMDYYKQIVEGQNAREQLSQNGNTIDEPSRKQLEQTVQSANQAKENLFGSKLGLVADIAKKFVGKGTSVQNLIHEGNQGVAKAVENLVVNNPEKFNGLVPQWITERMERAVKTDKKEESETEEE